MKLILPFVLAFLMFSCGEEDKKSNTPAKQPSPVAPPSGPFAVENYLKSANGEFLAKTTWIEGPMVGSNSFNVEILDSTQQLPHSLSVVEVKPWMTTHGHGSPMRNQKVTVQNNVIMVSGLSFVMAGPWDVHLKLTVNGKEDTVTLAVDVK